MTNQLDQIRWSAAVVVSYCAAYLAGEEKLVETEHTHKSSYNSAINYYIG